jgi:hypothetical protein
MAMGEVIDLQGYRTNKRDNLRNGLYIEIAPPVVFINYYENGVLTEQHRVISEYMLRELLDEMV